MICCASVSEVSPDFKCEDLNNVMGAQTIIEHMVYGNLPYAWVRGIEIQLFVTHVACIRLVEQGSMTDHGYSPHGLSRQTIRPSWIRYPLTLGR